MDEKTNSHLPKTAAFRLSEEWGPQSKNILTIELIQGQQFHQSTFYHKKNTTQHLLLQKAHHHRLPVAGATISPRRRIDHRIKRRHLPRVVEQRVIRRNVPN